MERNQRLRVRPAVEACERRTLPSGILAVMASTPSGHANYPISTSSIAQTSNQGPRGTNLALTPTGTPTAQELRRERFTATFIGTYTIAPGSFSTEASQMRFNGAGGSNTILHGDMQMLIVTPKDPSTPLGGVLSIFDRNINSNSVLGLDLNAAQTPPYVDATGRPRNLAVSLDVNTSAGLYAEGYAVGNLTVTYLSGGRPTKNGYREGKAIVRINAQVYSSRTNFLLANASIDPGPAGKA